MNPSLANLVFACGIAGLFFLDRDKALRTSKALWIPVMWLWLSESRGPSVWLGIAPPAGGDAQVQLDGTPLDRLIFMFIILAGIVALVHRRKAIAALKANWPVLIYFAFGLVSVVWSDFPGVGAKRWIKAAGDLTMVLLMVTDANPVGAFKRVLSRVGFILLPCSVLLIKYYPGIGRVYDQWHGFVINIGVTTNKNVLGVVVYVISLGTVWRILTLLRDKHEPNRGRHLIAQVTLLAFGIYLLVQADSATSKSCFALGTVLVIATSLSSIRRRPWAVRALVLMILFIGADVMLLGGGASLVHALGRKSDLTGRTGIWETLIPMAPNPVLGAGFETFWLGHRLEQVRAAYPGNPLNEAHNGYIEIYLNLGWVGLILMTVILVSGFHHTGLALRGRSDSSFAGLLLAYVTAGSIYSITEAGFRTMNPNWFFLLFSVVVGSSLASGVVTVDTKTATSESPASQPRIPLRIGRDAFDAGSLRRGS
jgi:exopolysaccharide production protein ExoQ